MILPVCLRNWRDGVSQELLEHSLIRLPPGHHLVVDPIECRSGAILSVQASTILHYCSLRDLTRVGSGEPIDLDTVPTSWEVKSEGLFIPAGLDADEVGIEGWVPTHRIERIIAENGGWVKDPAPALPTIPNILNAMRRALDL